MQLNALKRRHPNYKSTAVGRGGKRGKTSGRGTKGQKARAGHKIRPELRDLIKKIPKRRGESSSGSLKVIGAPLVTVSLQRINEVFENGETVSIKSLLKKGVVKRVGGKKPEVKIVGGAFDKKITVSGIPVTLGAKKLIEDKGGAVS